MIKCDLHENHVRFFQCLIENNDDGEMSVQKCSSLFRLSITVIINAAVIVVDRIHQAEIAVTIILTSSAEIAVTVIIIPVCIHINVI